MSLKTKILLTLILTVISKYGICQEYIVYDNYYFSPFIVNPAITGAELYPVADVSVKQQWLGFENAPTTYHLSGNFRIGTYDFYDPKGFVNKGPLKITNRVGVGAAIYRDNNGPASFTGGLISYAYHMPAGYKSYLSFGMAATGSYHSFNSSLLRPRNPGDDFLLNGNNNKFSMNFNIGAYYYGKRYFIGISADRILPAVLQVNDRRTFNPELYIIGGYKLVKEDRLYNIEPSIAVKKTGSEKLAVDFHTKIYIKQLNWIAISYGTPGSFNFKFAIRLYRKVYMGYNYGYDAGEISRYTFGSHEIHLGINLGLTGIEGIRNIASQKIKK